MDSPFYTNSHQIVQQGRERIFVDYRNMYNKPNVGNFGAALLGAAVLANTEMDHNFQNWYRKNVHSEFTDELAKVSKQFGEGWIIVPAVAACAVSYRSWQVWRGMPDGDCPFGEFTDRTMRGFLVGAPTVLFFQPMIGSDRPSSGESYWKPFQDVNGVSGHAFIGAVPFLTIAHMSDKPCVKGVFFALSTLTAWSRINDDAHYLSQALLGWYIAYLSVRAVSTTDGTVLPRGLTIFPVRQDQYIGMGIRFQF